MSRCGVGTGVGGVALSLHTPLIEHSHSDEKVPLPWQDFEAFRGTDAALLSASLISMHPPNQPASKCSLGTYYRHWSYDNEQN